MLPRTKHIKSGRNLFCGSRFSGVDLVAGIDAPRAISLGIHVLHLLVVDEFTKVAPRIVAISSEVERAAEERVQISRLPEIVPRDDRPA